MAREPSASRFTMVANHPHGFVSSEIRICFHRPAVNAKALKKRIRNLTQSALDDAVWTDIQ